MKTDTKKVLIVDDNEKNLKLLRIILQKCGYEVIEAQNGKEGLTAAQENIPELIFMDIQMPVMDGVTTLKLIRADEAIKHIPVVALTSYAMKGDRERFIGEGFDDYIAKPINSTEIRDAAEKYAGKRAEE